MRADERSAKMRHRFPAIEVENSDYKNQYKPGVITTERSKQAGVIMIQTALTKQTLVFADPFCSARPVAECKARLLVEMRNYQSVRKPSADPSMTDARVKYSGKSKTGDQDDVIVGLTQCYLRALKQQERDFALEHLNT